MALDVTTPHAFSIRAVPTQSAPVNTTPQAVILVPVPGGRGPTGPAGTGTQVFGETPGGTKDGVNTVFTTVSAFQAGSTAIYLNGLREFHYTETGASEITLEDPPHFDDTLRVDYVI
jgi:hypothetical protein